MKRLFILPLIALMSCGNDVKPEAQHQYVKSFTVDSLTYEIVTASDSCEYYRMVILADYISYTRHFHYPQCSHCKSKK